MIRYSPAKINLGLFITAKRSDGYHDLQSVAVKTPFYDIVELSAQASEETGIRFSASGLTIPGNPNENLCVKAADLFCSHSDSLSIRIHLHKRIPPGSGLGGGSSNAVTVLKGLNDLTGNLLNFSELHDIAAGLGSDCPLFLEDHPVYIEGRGEMVSRIEAELSGLYLMLINPALHISTAEAYQGIVPDSSRPDLRTLVNQPWTEWRDLITNDFERNIFKKYPLLGMIKSELYLQGAIYAAMSGSGSTIYGLFHDNPGLREIKGIPVLWQGAL